MSEIDNLDYEGLDDKDRFGGYTLDEVKAKYPGHELVTFVDRTAGWMLQEWELEIQHILPHKEPDDPNFTLQVSWVDEDGEQIGDDYFKLAPDYEFGEHKFEMAIVNGVPIQRLGKAACAMLYGGI